MGSREEEFVAFVDSHYELLNRRVIENPPAGFPHGSIESRVLLLLGNFVHAQRRGHVLGSSQGFTLPSGDIVEPDSSWVSKERWDAAPSPKVGEFLRVVPDLVVEILSKKTAATDQGEKKAIYQRNGVREYWMVDPRESVLTVFSLVDARYDSGRVCAANERFDSSVLPGLGFLVGDLFESA